MSLAAVLVRSAPAAEVPGASRTGTVGRVEVFTEFAGVAALWDELGAEALVSPYQKRAWLTAWYETVGESDGVAPFLIAVWDGEGRPLALLPLGVKRRGFMTVASFLGGRDSNFNLGLFRPGSAWSADAVAALLRRAARLRRPQVDLFILHNQPEAWGGMANPLAALPHQPSPSFAYKGTLAADPETLFKARLSKDGRKKLRRKAEKLAEAGTVKHRVARTPSEANAIVDAFAAHRRARCAAQGIDTAAIPVLASFLRRASLAGSAEPTIELHALYCGEVPLATFGGTEAAGRHCGMVLSFDSQSELARFSPGDLLVAAVIGKKCREGVTTFDLGIGEARYKDTYCPDAEPLFETVLTVSTRSRLLAALESWRLALKRAIKQSDPAWFLVRVLRQATATLRRWP